MRGSKGFFVLFFCFCLFFLSGCNFFKKSQSENSAVESAKSENLSSEIPVIVTAARIKKGDLLKKINTEGVVVCREVFKVNARVSGRVLGGVFRNGTKVKKGEILVSIDDRKYKLEKMQAESRLDKAIATLTVEEENLKKIASKDKAIFEKLNKLENDYKSGKIDFDTYLERGFELRKEAAKKGLLRGSVVLERTGVAEARYSLEQANINLEYCKITAPFNGIVANCEVFKGMDVKVGDHLLDLLNPNSFYVKASVIESELNFVKRGKGVRIKFEAFPDKTFKGRIEEINPIVDKNRSVDVYISINDKKGIFPGLYADVFIDTERIKDKFIVPKSAILTREGKTLIFTVDRTSHAKWVYVKVIAQNDLYAAIENASDYTTINEGDLVIVSNNLTLGHGSLVEVKKIVN